MSESGAVMWCGSMSGMLATFARNSFSDSDDDDGSVNRLGSGARTPCFPTCEGETLSSAELVYGTTRGGGARSESERAVFGVCLTGEVYVTSVVGLARTKSRPAVGMLFDAAIDVCFAAGDTAACDGDDVDDDGCGCGWYVAVVRFGETRTSGAGGCMDRDRALTWPGEPPVEPRCTGVADDDSGDGMACENSSDWVNAEGVVVCGLF